MFENASRKLKIWAKVVAYGGIALSVIFGIIMIAGGNSINLYGYGSRIGGMGVLVIIAGSLASWITALFIYNFADIAEQAAAMRTAIDNMAETNRTQMDMLIHAPRDEETTRTE